MNLARIADATIEPATHEDLFLQGRGYNIGNIMEATMRVYDERNYQVKDFAKYLKGNTLKETCKNIWQFIRKNIAYQKDPGREQWVRRPSRLWTDKEGDCKSYSVFTASCLHWLGINGVFRFVSYDPNDDTPVHVYVVVPDGNKEIVIDCVPEIKFFGQEAKYITKRDYSMDRLMELAGISNSNAAAPVAAYLVHTLALMEALLNERADEAKRNGGWLSVDRENEYQKAFAILQDQLRNPAIGDAATDDAVSTLASFTGIPGAGTFAKILTNILGNKPNPNDWKGWTPGDVKQWTANDGDSVANEAINIISYINAHGLQDITNSDAFGRDRVTIQQIASKLSRGGFPTQAQALLNGGSISTGTNTSAGSMVRPLLNNTANDINQTSGSNNTLLLLGGAAVAAYFILK